MEINGVVVDRHLSRPLNLAHSLGRKAEEQESKGDVTKAIEFHALAEGMLADLLQEEEYDIDANGKLSLTLQCKYHGNRRKFLAALVSYKQNEAQTANDPCEGAQNPEEKNEAKDGSTNFSLLKSQIQTGSVTELRSIGSKLLELVKMQQEQILYLSQKLQVINAENIAFRRAFNE